MAISQRAAVEAEFLETYRRAGIRTSRFAMLLAAALALLIFLLYYFYPPAGANVLGTPQYARIGCATVMGVAAVILIAFPHLVLRHYELAIGLPSAIGLMFATWIAWLVAQETPSRIPLLCVSIMLVYWLCYGLLRLPTIPVTFCCSVSTIFIGLALARAQSDGAPSATIYLVSANLIGYVVSRRGEIRERELFESKLSLQRFNQTILNREACALKLASDNERLLVLVGHDLHQPICGLMLYLSNLRSRLADDKDGEIHTLVNGIEACGALLADNIERILLENRDPIYLEKNRSPVPDLNLVFDQLAMTFLGLAKRSNVVLMIRKKASSDLRLRTDVVKLAAVLANLISNAVKYRRQPSGSTRSWVLVSYVRLRGRVRIDVVDNGVGIDSDDRERIFMERARVRQSSSAVTGNGLGLSSVRDAIASMPSHQVALSSRVGVGSRFSVYVPIEGGASSE